MSLEYFDSILTIFSCFVLIEFCNSIGQERDRFIIPRLSTNRIAELYEDEPPKNVRTSGVHVRRDEVEGRADLLRLRMKA